ncbi:hypothetical protein BTO30_01545 [Domibacillus antri]|uniref:Tetratricopeptide repeat protein n=1 Tax=Domibacillus antri TaxID=1714264 RepID=A0A1Q8Q9U8_9BACI|nr:hypothetical protein [Domibacillus antri]OLN24123.1 hypothetical protein BTO30_01545 [Domibacillus antri]
MNKVLSPVNDFMEFASGLPDSSLRAYETAITDYVSDRLENESFEHIYKWLKNTLAQNSPEHKKSQFSAFVLLCIYSRRMKNISKYKELIDEMGMFFSEEPFYPHIAALYHKQLDTLEGMESAIYYSRQAVANLPHQVGILHSYVESVINAIENQVEISDGVLDDAKEKMKTIMLLDSSYAKFHCTRGRLLAISREYSQAKNAINKAIDLEKSHKSDYALRINDYQSHLIRIQTAESSDVILKQLITTKQELEESRKRIEDSMDKMKTENIQLLGFFVAIISLTIGSLNMINDKPFMESALLIIILTGCILLTYTGLGVLFQPKNQNRSKIILISVFAVILIGAALLFYITKQ